MSSPFIVVLAVLVTPQLCFYGVHAMNLKGSLHTTEASLYYVWRETLRSVAKVNAIGSFVVTGRINWPTHMSAYIILAINAAASHLLVEFDISP
jgi:hypothetical protein